MFKSFKSVINNVLQFIVRWDVPGVSLCYINIGQRKRRHLHQQVSDHSIPKQMFTWTTGDLPSMWGKTKSQILILIPLPRPLDSSQPLPVKSKGESRKALSPSVSTGSLHRQELRIATFFCHRVEGPQPDILQLTHPCKFQDNRNKYFKQNTLNKYLQRRELCLSWNHFREICYCSIYTHFYKLKGKELGSH